MSKIKFFNCCEYGHYACDCPKPCDNANNAQRCEQNMKLENMMHMDNSSVREECVMMCMEVHYEDGDEDLIVYADQGVSTEEHDKAKTQSKQEEEVKYNAALANP